MLKPKAPRRRRLTASPVRKARRSLTRPVVGGSLLHGLQDWLLPYDAGIPAHGRWYLGVSRIVRFAELLDIFPVPESAAYVCLLRVQYTNGEPDIYTLPLSVARDAKAEESRTALRNSSWRGWLTPTAAPACSTAPCATRSSAYRC